MDVAGINLYGEFRFVSIVRLYSFQESCQLAGVEATRAAAANVYTGQLLRLQSLAQLLHESCNNSANIPALERHRIEATVWAFTLTKRNVNIQSQCRCNHSLFFSFPHVFTRTD